MTSLAYSFPRFSTSPCGPGKSGWTALLLPFSPILDPELHSRCPHRRVCGPHFSQLTLADTRSRGRACINHESLTSLRIVVTAMTVAVSVSSILPPVDCTYSTCAFELGPYTATWFLLGFLGQSERFAQAVDDEPAGPMPSSASIFPPSPPPSCRGDPAMAPNYQPALPARQPQPAVVLARCLSGDVHSSQLAWRVS